MERLLKSINFIKLIIEVFVASLFSFLLSNSVEMISQWGILK